MHLKHTNSLLNQIYTLNDHKAKTLLAEVDSVRYQVAIFNLGLQPTNPYNDVKTQLLYLDQLNHSQSTRRWLHCDIFCQ